MTATPYVDAVAVALPPALGPVLSSFDARAQTDLETLIRFCVDARCPEQLKPHNDVWNAGQTSLREKLALLDPSTGTKRARGNEHDGHDGTNGINKKAKLIAKEEGSDESPFYTIHALSVSSPVRKKVDLIVTPSSLRFVNASNGNLEARVPVSKLKRSFIVSNLAKNKNKEQWTVSIIGADTVDKKAEASEQLQVVFSIDKTVPSSKEGFRTTIGSGHHVTHEKGEETLIILNTFLSHLPEHCELIVADRDSSTFRASNGQPCVEAYRGAKEGLLCFLPRGILWANAKPCEFFALEDLTRDSDTPMLGGVKTVSATGRTLSVYVRRKIATENGDEEDADIGDEYEFAMIDGRESENINSWIRKHKNLFGKPRQVLASPSKGGRGKDPAENDDDNNDSDEDDEDFEASSESDGGEPSSGSSDEEQENEAETASEASDDEDGMDGEGELDEAHHPLMRPGAMPKMSKAAMETVVQMVADDFDGDGELGPEEEEMDELE